MLTKSLSSENVPYRSKIQAGDYEPYFRLLFGGDLLQL